MNDRQVSDHPKHPKRGLLLRELHHLLEALRTLHWRVRALLLESRLRRADQAAGQPRSPGIDAALHDYIQTKASESQDQETAGPGETERPIAPASQEKPAEVPHQGKETATAPSGVLGRFVNYLRKRSRSATMSPLLAEKLQQRTWEHITAAVNLAHQGNDDGARLHAELAENAMAEASRYMAEAEYDAFEKAVKEKLRTTAAPD